MFCFAEELGNKGWEEGKGEMEELYGLERRIVGQCWRGKSPN